MSVSLGLALLLTAAVSAEIVPRSPAGEYAPSEIIVKFSRQTAGHLERQLEQSASTAKSILPAELNMLNAKFKLKRIQPVFKGFRQKKRRLDALVNKQQAILTLKEKHLLKRLRRAPKGSRAPDLGGIYRLQLALAPGQSLREVLAVYKKHPAVEYAELNYVVSAFKTPNDEFYPLQWPLHNVGQDYPASGKYKLPPGLPDSDIDAPEAWDIATGVFDTIVAVVDTGVDYLHRDLENNMWVNEDERDGDPDIDDDGNGYVDDIYGYDSLHEDGDPRDDNGHGTHCAGVIAADANNGLDISGVCWKTRIMALKFLGSGGSGYAADAAEAIYYAVDNGADVISNSWGGYFPSQAVEEAIAYAHSQGVVIVASAGNDNSRLPGYPAAYDHVISVAATDSNDEKASFSNYGDRVDIAAPGVDILSLRASGTFLGMIYSLNTTVASGTSMSCPHVSGACALLLSIDDQMSTDRLYEVLTATTDPIAPEVCASGRLNIYNAVTQLVPPDGTVWFGRDAYSCADSLGMSVYDTDISGGPALQVDLSTEAGDSETVLLAEKQGVPGLFAGQIPTTSGVPVIDDGQIQLFHGQVITVTYYDASDSNGQPAISTDKATADCEGPVVTDVAVDVPGPEPKVLFQTDEPAAARLLYSQLCDDPDPCVAARIELETTHSVILPEVLPNTQYFFVIEVTDALGNQTLDDNAGQCYTFTTDGPGDIHVPDEYPTIQEAIDRSWDGGTVWVANGTYRGDGNRDIDFRGKAIIVRSRNGPWCCVIDCQGSREDPHRGFYFHSGEGADSVLDGFTIINGYAYGGSYYSRSGGAIRCAVSSPTIRNCIMRGNCGDWDGGGINNEFSNPTISGCFFIGNRAIGNDGGGINNDESSPTISNCTFIGNRAYDWGGAVRNVWLCSPLVKNCVMAGNLADDGGAMFYWYQCSPLISGCTIADNAARNGDALGCDSYADNYPSNIQFANCIISNSEHEIWNDDDSTITITYSNVTGGYPGAGNIDADPCFVQRGYWVDANNPGAGFVPGDYHLLPSSPCINTGDPAFLPGPNETDMDAQPRIFDGRIDMGADEFLPCVQAALKLTPRRLNPFSRGRWLKAHLVLPEGFVPADVVTDVALVLTPLAIESDYMQVFINKDGLVEIEAGFDRDAFCGLPGLSSVEVRVEGLLTGGRPFVGTDTITVTNNAMKCLGILASYWLGTDCRKPHWCGGLDIDQDSTVNFADYARIGPCCVEITVE